MANNYQLPASFNLRQRFNDVDRMLAFMADAALSTPECEVNETLALGFTATLQLIRKEIHRAADNACSKLDEYEVTPVWHDGGNRANNAA